MIYFVRFYLRPRFTLVLDLSTGFCFDTRSIAFLPDQLRSCVHFLSDHLVHMFGKQLWDCFKGKTYTYSKSINTSRKESRYKTKKVQIQKRGASHKDK